MRRALLAEIQIPTLVEKEGRLLGIGKEDGLH
jgi:hypothetical protein